MNGPAFIGELEQVVRPYHEKLVNHPAIEKINRGEAPRELIQRYLAYQFYNTRETVARILNRANRAPNDAVRDTLVKHASEELGHPEMALRLAEHFGLSADALRAAQMPLWVDFQVSWKWRLSQVGSFAENSAAVAFAEEGPFPEQCGKVRDGLKKHYSVEDERLLDFFTVHMMADEQHKEYGRQILLHHANTPELQRKALAAARRNLTLMLKIHDEVDSGEWTV